MGQRVQLHRLTKDNKWETFHSQFGYWYNMKDFFKLKEFGGEGYPENYDGFRPHIEDEPYFLLYGDNNNGYLLLDDKNKKYAFILGSEEFSDFANKSNNIELDLLKIASELKYSDWFEFPNDDYYKNISYSITKYCLDNPLTYDQYINFFNESYNEYYEPEEIEYLKEYSLMSKDDIKNFISKQEQDLDQSQKFSSYDKTLIFNNKEFKEILLKIKQNIDIKKQILSNILEDKIRLSEDQNLNNDIKNFISKVIEQTNYCQVNAFNNDFAASNFLDEEEFNNYTLVIKDTYDENNNPKLLISKDKLFEFSAKLNKLAILKQISDQYSDQQKVLNKEFSYLEELKKFKQNNNIKKQNYNQKLN